MTMISELYRNISLYPNFLLCFELYLNSRKMLIFGLFSSCFTSVETWLESLIMDGIWKPSNLLSVTPFYYHLNNLTVTIAFLDFSLEEIEKGRRS